MPASKAPLKTLADLKQVQQALADQRAKDAEAAARQAVQQKKQQADQNLFARAIGADTGATKPLRHKPVVVLAPKPPEPIARQHLLDEAAALREALSDEFDVSTLLDADDQMSFRRPGVSTEVTRKLRAGHWTLQGQIDLHGLRSDEAREALALFIRQSWRQGLRCLRVVHGKGLGSPGKQPVLKLKAQRWLIQKKEVLAFVQARASDGGAGALVVLLTPSGG
ncbi:MAG: DNA mismatch repair protein MutS [Comamonadaceae bacterium]|nr:MAG: DNA mismatch repair protein MutS [Comamonadaceae bacterium]